MQITLTGATGFLGSALVKKLAVDARSSVRAVVRRQSIEFPDGVIPINIGDLKPDTCWHETLSETDVVIHTAARVHVMTETLPDPISEFRKINVQATLNLARQAIKSGVKRFIFVSSIKVNGESTLPGRPYSADSEPEPTDPYSISKYEAEQELFGLADNTSMDVVVIRPPLIYGPGVKANFRKMICWLQKGVPLPLGGINNKRSLIALDNLVDLIITCVHHPSAANQIFLAGDGEDLSTTELLIRMGEALGKPARLIPIPARLLSMTAGILGKSEFSQRLCGSLQVDITKTRDLLGWHPPISVNEGLRITARAFLDQKI